MSRAFPAGGLSPADASHAQVLQARELVAKSLGDDARDLVFIPITPCTVWDTRFATDPNSSGIIADNVTKKFYAHLDGAGGSYVNWGGNPSCPETAQNTIGMRPFAVMMTAYVNDPTGNGWVTFYRDGDADPSQSTISVYYSPGPTRTQTVISKSSRGYGTGSYDVAVTSRFASANVSASVVGYFLKPVNIVLPNSTATTGNVMKGAARFIHNYGTGNTFMGLNAGNLTMTGANNVGIGAAALANNTTGQQNTVVGAGAMGINMSGSNNIALGYNAAYGLDGNHNIFIGRFVTTGPFGSSINYSNTIQIGNSTNHLRTYISGIRGVTTASADAVAVLIDSSGQLGTVNSSRRVKDDLADMDESSSALMNLRPVTFHYKSDQGRTQQYGLVAEEVAEVYPGLVAKSANGEVETVMYQFLPPMLLNEVQKQQRRIEELERDLGAMKTAMARLERATSNGTELR